MKTKWIFRIVAVIMILSIFSISQGADKFYFGSYAGKEYPSILKDSLRFNIIKDYDLSPSDIDSLAACSLRAIVQDPAQNSPSRWSGISHYTLWEAEGFPGSYVNLQYNGGTLVDDPSASGGKAMKFTGPGTPDIIQEGPSYYQEDSLWGDAIKYTAEFRLKFHYSLYTPLGPLGPGPPPTTKVCSLMVVDRETVLKDTVIYKSDFPSGGHGGYKTFELKDYTVPDGDTIDFQIYWFAPPEAKNFYIDYVKVYDNFGDQLMSGLRDTAIMDYVSQDWTKTLNAEGDTVIYRWYMRDEPPSIDFYMPTAHIDGLLKEVSQERVGFQAVWWVADTVRFHEYLLRQEPTDICADIYPMYKFGKETTGVSYQQTWDDHFIEHLNFVKTQADSVNKDFWLVTQAYVPAETLSGDCSFDTVVWDNTTWCLHHRDPSRYEVRLQTFLGLCYGADAIMYFRYSWWINGNGYLLMGLYDPENGPTNKWREIKNFTGPRMEKLGPVFNQLTWQGACSDDSVGSFTLRNGQPSYIRNIVPYNDYPPYVEVGFFTHNTENDSDYFMLVNRRCLSEEGDSFRVFLEENIEGKAFFVEDMYDSSRVGDIEYCDYNPEFTVYLRPGEGRLFKIRVYCYQSSHVIDVPEDYSTIQQGIDAALKYNIVLVDTGTYYENIDFRGLDILVTSKFYTTGDTSYISRTIIDGSDSSYSDSASVVRFISGEGSDACINGFTLRNGTGTLYISKGKPAKWGGGIYCKNSSPAITNNIIISNRVSGCGGGIYCELSSPYIAHNIITENRGTRGGGIGSYGASSSPIITNNIIARDTAEEYGGGIYGASNSIVITNNTIDQNYAAWRAGAICCEVGYVVNNIITNNSSPDSGGIWPGVNAVVCYNDVWNNENGNFYPLGSPPGAGDTTWGTNRNGTRCDSFYNIIQNPNFVDGYHLDDSSACIDAGDNDAPALPPTDFDGNTRVVDGDQNDSFFVDMGAYEYQPGGSGGLRKIAGGDKEDAETKSSSWVPHKFSLSQNYPNPFNPTTVLEFEIARSAKASLKIYNILGQLVRVLVDEEKTPGTYTVYWDGNDKNGQPVSSGIYFYKFEAGDFTGVKKMVLIK